MSWCTDLTYFTLICLLIVGENDINVSTHQGRHHKKKPEKLWVLSKVWVGGSRLKWVSKPNILAFLGGKLA